MTPSRAPRGMAHEHDSYSARVFAFTCPSLCLIPELQITPAASPRRMRVCFILSNLMIYQFDALYMTSVTKFSNNY